MKMKTSFLSLACIAGLLLAVRADVPEDVQKAVDKLKAADNYAWTTETEMVGAQRQSSPVIGKANKDGWAHIRQEMGDTTIEVVRKGKEAAMKTDDGWKKADELPQPQLGGPGRGGAGGGPGRGPGGMQALMGRRLLIQPVPAEQLAELVGKASDWKTTDAVHSAKLSGEAVQNMLMGGWRGGRGGAGGAGGANTPEASGRLKLWVAEGQVTKAEIHVDSTFTLPNGDSREIQSISRMQIKDIGKATVSIPEEAKKKLGS